MSVAVNPPMTPVTTGSNGIAAATIPNICKMPGPPAPFVPTPLPNIGRSGLSPKKYSKKVKVRGKKVAIKGATFKSQGDIASKGTGGGIISAQTHGVTKFVGPGSMDVKFEGKNVHLLSDPMLNNCGGSGVPPNSATVMGELQAAVLAAMEKNPSNDDVCGAGNHVEKIYPPNVPKSEMHPPKRIAKLRELAKNEEDIYEADAAQHNFDAGTIPHGKFISRGLTSMERAAGYHPDSQKVLAVCKVCGYRREIDHASDAKNTVEAKYSGGAIASGKQRTNNVAFAKKPNSSVTYKAPSAPDGTVEALESLGLKFIPTS